MKTNAMRFFKTEAEAEAFAKKANSNDWGWVKDMNGNITEWYVEYYEDGTWELWNWSL